MTRRFYISRHHGPQPKEPIERVLAAEQEAEREVARAREQANETIRDAREEARRIRERADARARSLRTHALRAANAHADAMRRAHAERVEAIQKRVMDPSHVGEAVRRVTEWLLGDEGEEEGRVT